MERVILIVKRANESNSCDLELPAEIPVDELSRLLSTALHWDQAYGEMDYLIKQFPSGLFLKKTQTLLSAQVRVGSTLEFIPNSKRNILPGQNDQNLTNTPPPPISPSDVVSGFVPVIDDISSHADISSPTPPSENVPPPPVEPKEGYKWKKIS